MDGREFNRLKKIRDSWRLRLLAIEGVVGLGSGEKGIVVFLEDEAASDRLPADLDGEPFTTEVTGLFHAL